MYSKSKKTTFHKRDTRRISFQVSSGHLKTLKVHEKVSTSKLDALLQEQPHSVINDYLDQVELGQICDCGSPRKKHSVLSSVLTHATNWDRILSRHLDRCVKVADTSAEDENDPSFAVEIDFRPIFGHKFGIVKEIVSQGHKVAQVVFSHPVFETYLDLQSRIKLSVFFKASFITFLIFLIALTVYTTSIFYFRKEEFGSTRTFPDAFQSGHVAEWISGMITAATLAILLLEEALLIFVFKQRYFKRLAAWLKLAVYVLTILTFILQTRLLILKYIAAISLPLAWFTLIVILSYHGSTISVMFLHILHKRFLGGFLLSSILAIAFGCGFQLISYSKERNTLSFSDIILTTFKPILMILGEFEYGVVHEGHKDKSLDLIYSSVLMLILAMAGGLVLVNLLLGLILSDIGHLYKLCHHKELFRKANQVVFYESLAKKFIWSKSLQRQVQIPEVIRVCVHDFCHCDNIQLSEPLKVRLKNILMKRAPGVFPTLRPKTAGMNCVIDDIL